MSFRDSLAALSERPFRLFWIGQTTSFVGDAMTPLALTFAVLHATGSAGDLGLVFAAYTLAHTVFILAGGVWSDRLERRLVMIACDLVRAAALSVLAALTIADAAELWHFVVSAFVVGAAESFFRPAATGLIPQAVSADRLQQANALIALVRSGAWVVGPAAAGILVSTVGAGWVFAIDAATFLVSVAFLRRLQVTRAPLPEPQSFLADLAHGWRAVRARRWVWASLLAFGVSNLAWGAQGILGPVVADRELGGPWTWGVIATCGGIGGILGGTVALRWEPRRALFVSHALVLFLGVYILLFAPPAPLAVLCGASLGSMFVIVVGNTLWETVLQREIPNELLSRVTSYDWAISIVLMPLGFALWGPLSERLGFDETLVLAGGLLLVSKAAVLSLPEIRQLKRAEPLEAPPATS
jgi:MFS family permease